MSDSEQDRRTRARPLSGRPVDERVPDVRDGLTRIERVVLWQLRELEQEREGRAVPSAQLYGRVVDYVNITPDELQRVLARLAGRGHGL